MKVVQINAVCGYGSTGKIVVDISKLLDEYNIENYIFYCGKYNDFKNGIKYAGRFYLKMQALKTRVLGNYGFNSAFITRKLIMKLKKINPDIIHLHNIHSHNINLPLFFKYLKNNNIRIVWTFHDCWAFTGGCAYFDYINCDQWKNKCIKCPRNNMSYFFDRVEYMFNKKKELFSNLENLVIVTPSEWLASLVKESFLRDKRIKVINNGIDTNLFMPTESEFRKKYKIEDKKIILAVSMGFGIRKGFKYYIELSKKIDKKSVIVLVGVSKEQIKLLPKNVIGIERTSNQKELAEIYSAADVFVNCTLEDNFPTVNIESLACGTPVITFKTGGSIECVDENVGGVVRQGDIDGIIKEINRLEKINDCSSQCVNKARSYYNKYDCYNKYLELYEKLGNG